MATAINLKSPPLLLGGALLIWGWQVQYLLLAGLLALLLEVADWLSWRWRISERELYRIVDGCAVGLAGLSLYAMLSGPPAKAIFTVLAGLPAVLWPLVAVQQYSTCQRLPLAALSWRQRRYGGNRDRTVDAGYPYVLLCLLAASLGNHSAPLFYLAVCGLWAWGLWPQRRTGPVWRWGSLLLVAALAGYGGHRGLVQLQGYLEEQAPEWLLAWLERAPSPFERWMALGTVGRLKQSSQIVLRLAVETGDSVPSRLRIASYSVFGGNVWYAGSRMFKASRRSGAEVWQLRPAGPATGGVRLLYQLGEEHGLLPLPLGSERISELPAEQVEQNPLGTVMVSGVPELLRYRVAYRPDSERDPPTDEDRRVPDNYRPALAALVVQLGLDQEVPGAVPGRLQRYFAEQFRYSLELTDSRSDQPPLLTFLQQSRAGHCEYFASAAVLLLRQAGIPARYASGFSVQEYSSLERRFIVRKRHAHAWAVAYLDGRWQDVDVTPATGWAVDAEQDSVLTGVYDLLSWLWSGFNEWQMESDRFGTRQLLIWAVPPLLLLLIWRLRRQPRVTLAADAKQLVASDERMGADSECYRIIAWYRGRGWELLPGEPLAAWLQRAAAGDPPARTALLTEVVQLHYRYRFDPAGLEAHQRRQLRALVEAWFASADPAMTLTKRAGR